MTCNCNGETPEYTIILDNVGLDGYSPTVGVIDVTEQKFNITLTDLNGTETTPDIPKLEYLEDTYVSNTSLASTLSAYSTTVQMNTALASKLDTDGSNASSSFTINNLPIKAFGSGTKLGELGDLFVLALQANDIRLQNYDYTNNLLAGIQLSNGNVNITTNGIARYNGYEVATLNDIPTKTSDLTNDAGFITSSDIPTVGNGTITFTQGGVTKGTITTNQSGNTTIDLDSGVTNPLMLNAYGEAGTGYVEIKAGNTAADNEIVFGYNTGGGTLITPLICLGAVDTTMTVTDHLNGTKKLSINEMAGCDSITGGASGLVPAPSAGDQDKFLKGDGTWDTVGGGGSSYTAGNGIDITNDTISVDSTVVALQSDLPTNYLTTDTSQTLTGGTKTMASGTSQVFVSGSSLDVRGNNTLFLRGASQAQGGYLGLAARSRDTVNDVAINVIRLQANTTGDLANLRLQGYDLYNSPYLYNGFTRLGQVNISSGDINITTGSGVELQYNGYEVATVNDIPDLSIINGGNANA